MLKKIFVIIVFSVLLTSSSVAVSSEPRHTLSSTNSPAYSPQTRKSNYEIEPKPIAPYPQIDMSERQASPSNASLLEKMIDLNMTSRSVVIRFVLPSKDVFLAIDGASQSLTYHVNYTVVYPNGTWATKKPITTLATSPMHFETTNPPNGTWQIIATVIEIAETKAWVQAVSYQNGTRLVTSVEKAELTLISGQAIYLKIPMNSPTDWFYLYVYRIAGGDVSIRLRKQGSYQTYYRNRRNSLDEFFPSKSHSIGVYLLSITNTDRADIFVEIMKPSGIKLKLDVDAGAAVKSLYRVDQDFFNISIGQSYDWIVLDGAVIYSGMSAKFLLINPDMTIIFQDTSSNPSDFIEKWISVPVAGKYILAIFGNQYATVTVKVTSASSLEAISGIRMDRNYSFAQSGQTSYLNISLFKGYFLLAGTTLYSRKVKFAFLDPSWSLIWNWGPSTGLGFSRPIKPTKPFYILKVQGETNSSSLVHLRFEGLEDYSIETPDASNYWSRFQGDIVTTNITVGTTSNYLFQHTGAVSKDVFVALFDTNYNEKWSRTFSQVYQTEFRHWRRGFENPPAGQWLQVVISYGPQSSGDKKLVEVSSLQSGDESKYVMTPYQFTETVDWDNWWQMRIYKVYVGSPKWFGIVSQLLPVNPSYPVHPSASMWVYDSTLDGRVSGQRLYYESTYRQNMFTTNFWAYPKEGTWLTVVVGFKDSVLDPLNLSVSFVGEADFHRDWPANLTGTTNSFPVTLRDTTFIIETKSNSTIGENSFIFDEPNQEIHFSVSGPQGTNGFSIVTIPKQLARGPFSVFLDNQPQNGILSIENSTQTAIFFSYEHSDHQVKIVYTTPGRIKLTVKSYPSIHGSPNPPYGEHWYDGGEEVTVTVNNVTDEVQGTRYRCTGWTGTGAVPQNGADTFLTFLLNQHSSITWNWTTQYRLSISTSPTGLSPQPNVSPLGPWFDSGTTVSLYAQSVPGYKFDHWTVDGINKSSGVSSISLKMDAPHFAVAYYKLGTGNIGIYVRDEKTGKAIMGATVKSLSQPNNQAILSGTTDRYGYVTFKEVKIGLYEVEASKTGYLTDTIWMNITQYQTTTKTIQLLPVDPGKSILKIYVQDLNGNPINGTEVVSTTQPSGQLPLNGTTDVDGFVAFKNILIGSYKIAASKTGYVTNKKMVTLTQDRTTTATIWLLKPDETGNMIVFVRESDNIPVNGAGITSTSQPEIQFPLSGTTNSTGYIEFTYIAPGSYTIEILKKGYRPVSKVVVVELQKIVNVTIQMEWDRIPPLVSVTVTPSNPDTTQTVSFTVTANDDEGGSGLASVALYIDQNQATQWTKAGTYTYTGGRYLKGTHAYYAVVTDNAGNEARDPPTGEKKFIVVEPPPSTLWMWLAAVSIAALVVTSTALIRRRIRTRKLRKITL